ncbi:hypothetical protein, partial [Limnospira sp. PMC 1280.21]|uniref:hypothetical protein n=1 Tax=Limnospira sp. PMC 1280.21 TaxID=2981063 RepID=UPI0028E0A842
FSTQFDDHGFGIAGPNSRWVGQIDFVKTPDGGRSEALHIDFGGLVDDVMLGIGMLGLNEGRNGNDETGRWTAFDDTGKAIGTGLIGPDTSALGPDVKSPGTYGEYPIAIDLDVPIARLVLEATQFG